MKQLKLIFLFLLLITFIPACKKCKECFIEETITATGAVNTNSIGEKCGKDLEEIDGQTYIATDGPVRTYCK